MTKASKRKSSRKKFNIISLAPSSRYKKEIENVANCELLQKNVSHLAEMLG
jgi:hypothetical protein